MMIITKEEKQDLALKANRNLGFILDKLGVKYKQNGFLFQSCCPCLYHAGDRNNENGWSYRIDIGRWICWTHHCEEFRGSDIFALVCNVLGVNFVNAMQWLQNTLENKKDDVRLNISHQPRTLHIHQPLDENQLKFLKSDPEYLLNRGFSKEILRRYQVGFWNRIGTYMHDRVIFPVRDHEGYLVGFTGRTIHSPEHFEKKNVKFKKWIHGSSYYKWPQKGEFLTSSILFNLNNAKKYIKQEHKIILVEGPLDGMKLEEAGIHHWCATLGTAFGSNHRGLLVNLGITDLYVAYDNDLPDECYLIGAGDRGYQRVKHIAGNLFNLFKIQLPAGKDPGDLSLQAIQEIFKGHI